MWFAKRDEWKGLRSIAMIEEERSVNGTKSVERRYFIGSLKGEDAKEYGRVVRQQPKLGNGLHWVLDVAFREDECRIRAGNASGSFAILRYVALNLLKNEPIAKIGVKNKRLKAGWSEDYLLAVLQVWMRLPCSSVAAA